MITVSQKSKVPARERGGSATKGGGKSQKFNPEIEEAQRFLVGGVNSPVRAFKSVGGDPLMLVEARGAEVRDAGGRRYADFIMGWGALLLGHNHPAVIKALHAGLKRGVLMGLTHPAEVELARLIATAVPSVEQIRFTTSGTEACMIAVRLARAHTGRAKVLTCSGGYHGHGDSLMAGKTAGLPDLLARETLTVPYNDPEALQTTIQRYGTELACVIIEPVAANMGVVVPEPGYLGMMRELTSRYGIMLLFDEVVTGFRVGRGGAQGYFGIKPDLTTFGKIIGGGLPIGAVGGSRAIMQRLAPIGDVFHGGTFAGHPLSMASGIATLKELDAHPPYERLERLAQRLVEGLVKLSTRSGVAIRINRLGSMFTIFFSESPVRNAQEANASRQELFAQWANGLRRSGVLIPPSPFEALFLSSAHTETHVERFLKASQDAFKRIRRPLFHGALRSKDRGVPHAAD